jgi:DNA-binding MarR family transcriptional regulator
VTEFALDAYVVDVLMRDLVGHDKSPSSFVVYLYLWARTRGRGEDSVALSHQSIAEATGLSKSAVQSAVRNLARRKLIQSSKSTVTSTPEYSVDRPWRRRNAAH